MTEQYKIREEPKPSGWTVYLLGGPDKQGSYMIKPAYGTVPCAFHRWM